MGEITPLVLGVIGGTATLLTAWTAFTKVKGETGRPVEVLRRVWGHLEDHDAVHSRVEIGPMPKSIIRDAEDILGIGDDD